MSEENNEIELHCPKCGQHIAADIEDAGKRGKCPFCDEHFQIPDPAISCHPVRHASPIPALSPTPKNPSAPKPNKPLYILSTPNDFRDFAQRRWIARVIDLHISLTIATLILHGVFPSMATIDIPQIREMPERVLLVNFIRFTSPYFLDALIYGFFKQTLGKKLFGIRICDPNGIPLDTHGYFRRNARLFLKGDGCNLPLVCMFTRLRQYFRVKEGKPATYEEDSPYQARATRPLQFSDYLVTILVVLLGVCCSKLW